MRDIFCEIRVPQFWTWSRRQRGCVNAAMSSAPGGGSLGDLQPGTPGEDRCANDAPDHAAGRAGLTAATLSTAVKPPLATSTAVRAAGHYAPTGRDEIGGPVVPFSVRRPFTGLLSQISNMCALRGRFSHPYMNKSRRASLACSAWRPRPTPRRTPQRSIAAGKAHFPADRAARLAGQLGVLRVRRAEPSADPPSTAVLRAISGCRSLPQTSCWSSASPDPTVSPVVHPASLP
jgi:hypothetical protein